jgi:hypothetical protein
MSVSLLCANQDLSSQVETLILVVNEPEKNESETWLSDGYVDELIGSLESG